MLALHPDLVPSNLRDYAGSSLLHGNASERERQTINNYSFMRRCKLVSSKRNLQINGPDCFLQMTLQNTLGYPQKTKE